MFVSFCTRLLLIYMFQAPVIFALLATLATGKTTRSKLADLFQAAEGSDSDSGSGSEDHDPPEAAAASSSRKKTKLEDLRLRRDPWLVCTISVTS